MKNPELSLRVVQSYRETRFSRPAPGRGSYWSFLEIESRMVVSDLMFSMR
jgi:hypothetical protein